jgi:hypothetical protein
MLFLYSIANFSNHSYKRPIPDLGVLFLLNKLNSIQNLFSGTIFFFCIVLTENLLAQSHVIFMTKYGRSKN